MYAETIHFVAYIFIFDLSKFQEYDIKNIFLKVLNCKCKCFLNALLNEQLRFKKQLSN